MSSEQGVHDLRFEPKFHSTFQVVHLWVAVEKGTKMAAMAATGSRSRERRWWARRTEPRTPRTVRDHPQRGKGAACGARQVVTNSGCSLTATDIHPYLRLVGRPGTRGWEARQTTHLTPPDSSSIVLNARIVSVKGNPAFSVYSATKAAVRSFARSWSMDLRERKIRVNAISPGVIPTPGYNTSLGMSDQQVDQFVQSSLGSIPLGRTGTTDEIAKAVMFLACLAQV